MNDSVRKTRASARLADRDECDDVFVDALWTPPVSFTLGSVIAHLLNVGMVRRQTVVETRDPIEWERAMAARA